MPLFVLSLIHAFIVQVKMPPGGNLGALVTFGDEANRQRALQVLNDNCKFKGRLLTATKCKAHIDPYEKAQVRSAHYGSERHDVTASNDTLSHE